MNDLHSPRMARRLIWKYRCAQCGGPLRGNPPDEEGRMAVACTMHGSDHYGYITAWYVKRAIERAKREYQAVIANLQDTEFAVAFGLVKPIKRRTPEEARAALERNKKALGRDAGGLT